MRISRKKSKIPLLTLGIISLLICAAALLYSHKINRVTPSTPVSTHEETGSPINPEFLPKHTDPASKQNGVEGTSSSDTSAGAHAFPTTQPNLSITIGEVDTSRHTLIVKTKIEPEANGECLLELSSDGTVLRTAKVNFSEHTCPFSPIDTSALQPSIYDLTIKVSVGSNRATSTKSINIH